MAGIMEGHAERQWISFRARLKISKDFADILAFGCKFPGAIGVSGVVTQQVAIFLKVGAAPEIEEHTSELQSPCNLVCRLLLEKKKKKTQLDRNAQSETYGTRPRQCVALSYV